jgi:hypothetical protein
MDLTQARDIVGGLTLTSKMPEASYSLSAHDCVTGSKLAQVPDSVCSKCYALKGNYVRYPAIKRAQARRKLALTDDRWTRAMAVATSRVGYFRWFDSGDVQSMSHLIKIVAVACLNPEVNYWLPTKEIGLVRAYRRAGGYEPPNLVIRLSAPMINQRLRGDAYGLTSMVVTSDKRPLDTDVHLCNASHTLRDGTEVTTPTAGLDVGHCGDCRACWSTIRTVAYPIH